MVEPCRLQTAPNLTFRSTVRTGEVFSYCYLMPDACAWLLAHTISLLQQQRAAFSQRNECNPWPIITVQWKLMVVVFQHNFLNFCLRAQQPNPATVLTLLLLVSRVQSLGAAALSYCVKASGTNRGPDPCLGQRNSICTQTKIMTHSSS